jgi:hypothetical protein
MYFFTSRLTASTILAALILGCVKVNVFFIRLFNRF